MKDKYSVKMNAPVRKPMADMKVKRVPMSQNLPVPQQTIVGRTIGDVMSTSQPRGVFLKKKAGY